MADHVGMFMSSLFPVKDRQEAIKKLQKMKDMIDDFTLFDFSEEGEELFHVRGDYDGMPTTWNNPATGEFKDLDPGVPELIQELLPEDGFCRVTDIGNMKFQYIHAMCWDITKKKIYKHDIGVSSDYTELKNIRPELGEVKELKKVAKQVCDDLDKAINSTPTGPARDTMTNARILLMKTMEEDT